MRPIFPKFLRHCTSGGERKAGTLHSFGAFAFILCAALLTNTGCGPDVSLPATAAVPVVVAAQAQSSIGTVMNFGDSITCGYGVTPADGTGYVISNEGYAGLLDAAIGKPAQNLCRPGDQAADMTRQWVYPDATPAMGAHQLYTVLIGTNDVGNCGASGPCVANYLDTLSASLAWLAMPAEDKVLANSIPPAQRTGTWTPDLGFGLGASANGASLTFNVQQVFAGRPLYLAYHVYNPGAQNGLATVSIDGTVAATLSQGASNGHVIDTLNGTTDTVFLARVPLGAAGQHTVSLTLTSPDGSPFFLLWAGAPSRNYTTVAGSPRVIVGEIITSDSSSRNVITDIYNASLEPMLNMLAADGLNIQTVPSANALDPSKDFVDGLHPNNLGSRKLAAVFASSL